LREGTIPEYVVEDKRRTGRAARAALVLAMAALLAFTLLTVAQDDDNAYMDDAEYVGSARCYDCHDGIHDTWADTYHAGAFAPATGATVVADWTADASFDLAPGVPVTPELVENASGLFMDLDGEGTDVYQVTHVQGAGNWLQVYLTEIGNTRYILPLAWANTVQAWVPFHPEEWYDPDGTPRMAGKLHVWDLQCGACHTAGFAVAYNDTSGEYTGEWAEDGVTCESCHGPGSLHAKTPSGKKRIDYIWRTYDSGLCGNCHVGATPVGNVNGMPTGYPLNALGETIQPGDVHSDFYDLAPDLHPDGETVKGQAMQYNDYLTSRHEHSLTTLKEAEDRQDFCLMCHSTDYLLAEEGEEPDLATAEHDIECSLCHGMHGTSEENNLRLSKWDTCVQCHRNGDLGPGEDPLPPQKELVSGTIPIEGLEGEHWMGDILCTDCHMPTMGVREVPYDIPSHTWYFISPSKSIELGMPNSCTVTCHGQGSAEGALTDEEAMEYIEDSIAAVEERVAATADALTAAKDAVDGAVAAGYSQEERDAANSTYTDAMFILDLVERDGTHFHNPDWQMEVLSYAIDLSAQVVVDLATGTVKGVVVDPDGKGQSGIDVSSDNRTWATTAADGSFQFDILPGDHTFALMDGDEKVGTFTATVISGQTADAGKVKLDEEGDGSDLTLYIVVAIVVVIVVIGALLTMRGGKGE
jgi:predicted CXXCH cytochrome family protein